MNENVIYLGIAVIFLFITIIYIIGVIRTIVYIIGVIRKNKSLKETAFNMFSSMVNKMSFLFVGGVITAAVFTFIYYLYQK